MHIALMPGKLDSVLTRRKLTNSALGGMVGKTPSAISRIRRSLNPPSPKLAIAIEAALDGEVTRGDLRPDLWPAPRLESRAA